MSRREIIAYAITRAPPGVKGGPYEAESGPPGEECDNLRDACRWPTTEADARECAVMYLEDHLSWQGDARVIRIVRARPTPSEAAAEVLRDLVAYTDFLGGTLTRIQARARRVLAASGPDPMPVVRAAMQETEAEEALRVSVAAKNNAPGVGLRWRAAVDAWLAASKRLKAARAERGAAVDAYRKAGGK